MIVLAGPSGAGKSRLAERIGLPVLRLDDFYKSGGDPTLPLITEGANAGIVDWDDPASWLLEDAMAALDELCRDRPGRGAVYDIAQTAAAAAQTLDLGEHDALRGRGHLRPGDRAALRARPGCSRRRTASASTRWSRSGAG